MYTCLLNIPSVASRPKYLNPPGEAAVNFARRAQRLSPDAILQRPQRRVISVVFFRSQMAV